MATSLSFNAQLSLLWATTPSQASLWFLSLLMARITRESSLLEVTTLLYYPFWDPFIPRMAKSAWFTSTGITSIYSYGIIADLYVSHLDTWKPAVFGGAPSAQAAINHGTYFYWASQEGLIKNGSSIASVPLLNSVFRLPSFFFCFFVLKTLILVYPILTARCHSDHSFWPSGLHQRRRFWFPKNWSPWDWHHW